MNIVQISLSTQYVSKPAYCKVYCYDDLIFDDYIKNNIILDHYKSNNKKFSIKIIKSGKTLDVVKNKEEQIVTINEVKLNNISLKIKEFGNFKAIDNAYVDDYKIQTNVCSLNGEWHFELLQRDLIGITNWQNLRKPLRDSFQDCDIACFGCSNTRGAFLKYNETWPYCLSNISGYNVKNYGIGGSNMDEITAVVNEYLEKYRCKFVIIMFPHSMRRQTTYNSKIENLYITPVPDWYNGNSKKFINEFFREFIMHGEEHSIAILAGQIKEFLDKCSQKTKIFFTTYQASEYVLLSKTQCKEYILPFLDPNKYPKASDGEHFGIEYCKEYARIIKSHIFRD